MAKKAFVRDDVPLSRFGVLVAQLESIVASASQQPPDALLCFDLLSDLVSAVDEEPKESILFWQRKCEDALYSLLILGAKRPIRHLASVAMARIIGKGDGISRYSRASSLQGFLSDGKKSEPLRIAGATQCLGELYRHFGRRITSGLLETAAIATKLLKFNEDFVRQEALNMLQNALEGSAGNASFSAYTEAFRIIMRLGIGDKSFVVRVAAARCLKAFANIGGPGLGAGELENAASCCVKALEDPVASVRDAFAEALGMLLAFGMNPEAQVQARGKTQTMPSKKFEGGLQRHLVLPFMKASGLRSKGIRIGITLSWIFFLQAMHLKYLHPDTELQNFVLQVMEMLRADTSVDTQALACVLYILRVGVTDQMTEPTQRGFLAFLANQLQSPDVTPSMAVATLRTLSYTLQTLGEMPLDLKEVLDNSVVAAVSHFSQHVRVEAALALRALAVVDPTCVGGLISFGVTTLNALRETVSFEKGSNLQAELDSLHGQASVLAALVSISPNLPLGYPTRLPKLVLEVAKKLLTDSCRNPIASAVVEQAGWLLLSSLLVSMPKEELEDQVFDILSLWAPLFSGNPEYQLKQAGDLASRVSVWADAIDALTAFARCFLSPNALNSRVLLQPVLYYLSRALSYVSILKAQDMTGTKPSVDVFIISLLIAYQCLPDPMSCKSDHPQIIQLCTTPFRDASGCEESSCLRTLLDKRDAWLGPWVPGRDWFEDELRAFQGGKDGLLPCVWESELSSFPQPESISKTLVNQMLLCFGLMFSCQDNAGKLSLLGMIELCLKGGKKQPWRAISINNICVGLLAGLKAVISLHPHQPLGLEILGSLQSICQGILSDGDIGESQRRAASESLGLLARFGDDLFTARMTRSLLGDVTSITDSNYAGSLALALGCIHRSYAYSAGGMALSTLVPPTVSSISSLAKSSASGLQIWSLHGLLLTIESAGLSYVSQVQATLGLALDIFLSEENGWVDLYQGVGRLINAIVAVLGPELSPGSIFFSRCKFVIAEISSYQETATLIESVRFTQQLVLFAPQAVSVHSHVNTLLRTLMSRQPILRHLAVSTLRHLVEKDPVSIVNEQIEENLFHMLDEETDSEIGNLVRTTLRRLLYASCPLCPSNWISICRNMVLAASTRTSHGLNSGLQYDSMSSVDGEMRLETGDDGETMVSSYNGMTMRGSHNREKHLRYRTRTFAAECLSHLPSAVGIDPAHFDPSLARKSSDRKASGDFLVLHLQELVSLAYQISTIQFENMQPIGVELLTTIMEKFEMIKDPELPGHLLLEQYQAQLVSAVRTALDASSGPVLLEAGLRLATKMLTSGIISGDQAAVKRIFSLLSRPLDDFNDLYYPSFAEWVSCKIKIRLLAAHASLKCYSYSLLRRHHNEVPDEYKALLPLFSKSSRILGKYWISILKDYNYICLGLHCSTSWRPFLDGIQSPFVSSKLGSCLEEAWPMVLQAVSLDAIPLNSSFNGSSNPPVEIASTNGSISGYSMVELTFEEFQFLWGFALLILFQRQHQTLVHLVPLSPAKSKFGRDSPGEEMSFSNVKLYEVVLPVFQFLSTESFFRTGFLPVNICLELLQVVLYSIHLEDSWNSLAISVFSQVVEKCPEDFFAVENFVNIAMELCLAYLLLLYRNVYAATSEHENGDYMTYPLFTTAKVLLARSGLKNQMRALMAFLLIGHKCSRKAATESCFSKATEFVICTNSLLKTHGKEYFAMDADSGFPLKTTLEACVHAISSLTMDCIRGIHELGDKTRPDKRKLLLMKLAFSLEQIIFYANQAFELECHRGAKNDASSYLTYLNYCSMIMHTALTDSELQVQAIALQVLKAVVQKCSIEENGFVLFFMGEIIGDIFSVLQKMLEKSLTRESVAVAGECLKIMVLVQALSKANESEMLLMTLLLESIVMVFSASESDSSKEVNDIRSTAMKLVSHLAQVPSSAIIFKDVLLEMPLTHRQQLQGVIRASVSQDLNPSPLETSTSLVIKFPTPVEESREKVMSPKVDKNNTKDDDADEDEDEEDDWDTFQSFPASTDMPAADSNTEYQSGEPEIAEDSSHIPVDNRLHDLSTSPLLNGVGETADAKQNEAPDEPRISEHSCSSHAEPSDLTKLAESSEAMPVQQNEQLLSDPQPLEDVEISNKLSLRVDYEDIKQSLDDTIDLEVSSVPLAATDSEGRGEADDCSQREHDPDGNEGSEGRLPIEMECRSVQSEKEKDGCLESPDHQNESAKEENEK